MYRFSLGSRISNGTCWYYSSAGFSRITPFEGRLRIKCREKRYNSNDDIHVGNDNSYAPDGRNIDARESIETRSAVNISQKYIDSEYSLKKEFIVDDSYEFHSGLRRISDSLGPKESANLTQVCGCVCLCSS